MDVLKSLLTIVGLTTVAVGVLNITALPSHFLVPKDVYREFWAVTWILVILGLGMIVGAGLLPS